MSSKPRIVLEHLTKTYHLYARPADRLRQMLLSRLGSPRRLYQEFHALHDLCLEVADGEVLGIVGHNGAGKSTLLQLVCGTLTPTSGTVHVHGRIAALLELGAGFNPEFTGRENVLLNAAVLGLTREDIARRLDAIVAFADIGPFIDQPVKTYSSGMFVRLAFAVASAVEPDILVIDEALAVGDGAFARKSFERILELKRQGTTILFCSHSLYQVEAFCTRVLWLHAGRCRMLGDPGAVISAYAQHLAAQAAGTPELPADIPLEGSIPPRPPASAPTPAGSGRITQVEVRLGEHTGRSLHGPSGAVDLHVAVAFTMDPQLPLPTVGVVLDYGSVVAASSVVSRTDGVLLTRDPQGRGAAQVTFPQIPLRKGEYRVSVYLACENAVHLYDQVVSAATLTLEDHAPEPGLVHLAHGWTTGHVLVHGRPFVLDPADSLGLGHGPFEPGETALVRRLVRPGMRCLDVGANIGYYTLLLAQLAGPTGLVVAVEPDPANQELLRHNLAPELDRGQVRLVPAALGHTAGRVRLFHAASAGMHRIYPSVCCSSQAVEVELLPGDHLGLAPLDFLKIDVEGAESAVIAGLAHTIAASPNLAILAEFSPLAMLEAGHDPATLVSTLASLGFVPHSVDPHGQTSPLDPKDLALAAARIPAQGFAQLRAELAGKSPTAQAEAAQAFLAACSYPRPLYETLLWSRTPRP
ncbi:hypothetical protein TDMWS_18840 [Thermodesulfomicrobium sp. WS]|uniref:FkbM family methyltransferase n=1 Tax=Thermodesulfomicrobium sp. WS TaxID=3004129 RepID=UPI002491C2AC|nr:FkbM family methyltransferase [Thermodesulfomicrobium sp. WS]BDV01799.1 hypothetical protein TDMWS_18840 [Thermodesulfomicrobium sp. WS]